MVSEFRSIMSPQDNKYQVKKRKSSLIELYILPEKHIKHLENVSNLSVILSVIFIMYSIVNIVLYYSTGECIRDNIDVIISTVSLLIPVAFTGYIFFIEKYIYSHDTVYPNQPHNNDPNIQHKPVR